jgi:hypothetical protein
MTLICGEVTIRKNERGVIGLKIGTREHESFPYIVEVLDHSPAALDQTLASLDFIANINRRGVVDNTAEEVERKIQDAGEYVTIGYVRHVQSSPQQMPTEPPVSVVAAPVFSFAEPIVAAPVAAAPGPCVHSAPPGGYVQPSPQQIPMEPPVPVFAVPAFSFAAPVAAAPAPIAVAPVAAAPAPVAAAPAPVAAAPGAWFCPGFIRDFPPTTTPNWVNAASRFTGDVVGTTSPVATTSREEAAFSSYNTPPFPPGTVTQSLLIF